MAASARPRVFFDTNVLISALRSADGPPAAALRRHIEGHITAVVSQQVVEELIRTIDRKLPGALSPLRQLLLSAPPEVVPDPPAQEVERLARGVNRLDAPLLAAALIAEVEYLVSGDATFLREARRLKGTPAIVTPRELLQRLGPSE